MSPEADPSTVVVNLNEQAFQAAFRRGRLLVRIMVGATVAFNLACFADSTWNPPSGVRQLDGAAFILLGPLLALFSWLILRGAKIAVGCFVSVFAPFVLLLLITVTMVPLSIGLNLAFAPKHGVDLRGSLQSMASILYVVPVGALSSYGLWVLLISKDARLYREARRQGIVEPDANVSP